MTLKLVWRVSAEPTGRYRSFDKRQWPFAYYATGEPAVMLLCADGYSAKEALTRMGSPVPDNHAPIHIHVADHSQNPWQWRQAKYTYQSLQAAKAAALILLQKHPELQPKPATSTEIVKP